MVERRNANMPERSRWLSALPNAVCITEDGLGLPVVRAICNARQPFNDEATPYTLS